MPVTSIQSKWQSDGSLDFQDTSGTSVIRVDSDGAVIANAKTTQFGFAAAAGGANVCEVTVTAQDATGTTVAAPHVYTLWLSDAATGAGLTATSASGTVTVKAASGAVLGTLTAKKALVVQSLATGVFTLEITDTAKTGFYVAAQAPNGGVSVSSALVTGDYGS